MSPPTCVSARGASGSRPTASAASPWARSPGRRRAAITRSCARRPGLPSAARCSVNSLRRDRGRRRQPVRPVRQLLSGRRSSRGPSRHRRLPARPLADVDAARRQRAHRALALHAARPPDDRGDVAARRVGRRLGTRAPVRQADDLGTRLPRAAPRERRARARRRRRRGAGDDAPVRRACRRCTCTTMGCFARGPTGIATSSIPLERERGLDGHEDLFTPGELQLDLVPEVDAVAIFSLEPPGELLRPATLRHDERMRRGALIGGCDERLRAPAAARRREVRRRAATSTAPSSPAIPGSPTGGATRSSRCRGWRWRPAGRRWRASCSLAWAPTSCATGSFPTASPTPARPSTTASTRRCGSCSRRGASSIASMTPRRARACCRRCAPSSTASSPARIPASASTTTASCTRPRRGCR